MGEVTCSSDSISFKMAKISIIFSTIALCLLTKVFAFDDIVNESLEDQERNYQARKLAEEYIWKQVDPQEEKWPHKEAGIIYKKFTCIANFNKMKKFRQN